MKRLELPERWWRRWDNNPGTILWWLEYYVWKFTGLCYYPNTSAPNNWLGWVRGGRGCAEGMEAERSVLNPSLWEPAEIVEFKPTFHKQPGDPVLHVEPEYRPWDDTVEWELPS